MVEPGRVQGRWPSPVPRCTSANIITRIAFWLPSACGIAPTPMKAPGLMSAIVAGITPNTPTLSVSVTRCSSPLPRGFTTMVGPSTPTMVPTTRTVFCCACTDVTTSAAAIAAPARVLIMIASLHRRPDAVAAVAHGRRFDRVVVDRLGVVEEDMHAGLEVGAVARHVAHDHGLRRDDHFLLVDLVFVLVAHRHHL